MSDDRGAEQALSDVRGFPSWMWRNADVAEFVTWRHLPPAERAALALFHARLGQQFDAVIDVDATRAVEPLERTSEWDREPLPDTYPTGI